MTLILFPNAKKETLYYLLIVKEVIRETSDAITIHFNQPDKNKLILFGGGSRIIPLISLAKAFLYAEPESSVALIYANRDENSIIFKNNLEELQKQFQRNSMLFMFWKGRLKIGWGQVAF